jgi:arginine decarboxylase-like protein
MLDGITSSESSIANQFKAGIISLQQSAQSEQQIANLVASQVQQTQASSQSHNNPPHLGQNVDTNA